MLALGGLHASDPLAPLAPRAASGAWGERLGQVKWGQGRQVGKEGKWGECGRALRHAVAMNTGMESREFLSTTLANKHADCCGD